MMVQATVVRDLPTGDKITVEINIETLRSMIA